MMRAWRPGRVLDLCCGHGRHLVPLAKRGHCVTGIDASQLMVSRATAASRAARAPASVVQGDASLMPFPSGAFDAVICLFNSFGYMESDDANEAILREVTRCLSPGGRFLLDTRNRAFQLSHLPFSEIVPVESGGAVWLECDVDESGDRLVSVFRCAGTGRMLHQASIRAFHLHELRAMFTRAGLHITETYGGYHWGPFRPDSRELLIVATKP